MISPKQQQHIIDTSDALRASGRVGFTIAAHGTEYTGEAGGYAVGSRRYATIEEAVADMSPDLFLGWWRSEDGVEHIDLVRIFPSKFVAILAALDGGEAAIYGFAEDEVFDILTADADVGDG